MRRIVRILKTIRKRSKTEACYDEALDKVIHNPIYVWVTFDPLYERLVCVHDVPDCDCVVCKPIMDERLAENSTYHLEEHKMRIREYDRGELKEV